MICSVCNKNTAVVFLNKIENGKKTVEGLCYNCAKEKGINPLEVLAKNANISNEELEDMSNQFENILKDFSENMNLEALKEIIDGVIVEVNNPNDAFLAFATEPFIYTTYALFLLAS